MDVSDQQAQQRIMQQMASINNTNSSATGTSTSFSGTHQQQLLQQAALASQQKQLQQSQLSGFMYNANEAGTPSESSASATISALEIANNPSFKIMLQQAQRNAVKDLLDGITNRAINVSIPATECLCRKDFAMNPDDKQLRRATHKMMRAMTASMTAITCREPLLQSIQAFLKQAISTQMNIPPQSDVQKQLEETVAQLAELSVDQAVNFIVKNASDKAISSIDVAMESDYVIRAQCRNEGRPFKYVPGD